MESNSKHWDKVFLNAEDIKLGWYEKEASQTFKLLNLIPKWQNSKVFIPGAGTSVLIDKLITNGANIIINDISVEALNSVKKRLGEKSKDIKWLCQDIADPIKDVEQDVDIWIDRAVLHFLTDEDRIKEYFNNVKSILKVKGYAIFAEFSKTGAPKCAGLTLHRYSVAEMSKRLGPSFKLISHFDYTIYKFFWRSKTICLRSL